MNVKTTVLLLLNLKPCSTRFLGTPPQKKPQTNLVCTTVQCWQQSFHCSSNVYTNCTLVLPPFLETLQLQESRKSLAPPGTCRQPCRPLFAYVGLWRATCVSRIKITASRRGERESTYISCFKLWSSRGEREEVGCERVACTATRGEKRMDPCGQMCQAGMKALNRVHVRY